MTEQQKIVDYVARRAGRTLQVLTTKEEYKENGLGEIATRLSEEVLAGVDEVEFRILPKDQYKTESGRYRAQNIR